MRQVKLSHSNVTESTYQLEQAAVVRHDCQRHNLNWKVMRKDKRKYKGKVWKYYYDAKYFVGNCR